MHPRSTWRIAWITSLILTGLFVAPASTAASSTTVEHRCPIGLDGQTGINCVSYEATITDGPCSDLDAVRARCALDVAVNVTFHSWVHPGEAHVSLSSICHRTDTAQWLVRGDVATASCTVHVTLVKGTCEVIVEGVNVEYRTLGRDLQQAPPLHDSYPNEATFRADHTVCA